MKAIAVPHFLARLTPPRPTFGQDMTADEGALMQAHVDYWLPHLGAGLVVAMGPVADPAGVWGAAIVNAPSLGWLQAEQAKDPVILSGRGFVYQNLPMPTLKVAPVEPLAPVSSVSP